MGGGLPGAVPRCGSAAASAPAARCERAGFVPIGWSAPPPICSSSDLQLDSKHSQDHGSPEADTVDPEPSFSALGSALGSKKEIDF